jgi:hypothetical protein
MSVRKESRIPWGRLSARVRMNYEGPFSLASHGARPKAVDFPAHGRTSLHDAGLARRSSEKTS